MDSDDSASYVGHMTIHESPDSPDSSQHSRDEPTHQLGIIQEVNAAADLGQDLAQDNQDSSDSAYDADTISDSPNSTSSTFKLNVSSDSSSEEDDMHMPLDLPTAAAAAAAGHPMGIMNYDEAGFGFRSHMPLHLPTAAAAAEAAAAQYIRIRNGDETGFRVCALHSAKHLHTACPGCSCKCEAEDIAVKLPAANIHFFYVSDEEDDGQDSAPKDM